MADRREPLVLKDRSWRRVEIGCWRLLLSKLKTSTEFDGVCGVTEIYLASSAGDDDMIIFPSDNVMNGIVFWNF